MPAQDECLPRHLTAIKDYEPDTFIGFVRGEQYRRNKTFDDVEFFQHLRPSVKTITPLKSYDGRRRSETGRHSLAGFIVRPPPRTPPSYSDLDLNDNGDVHSWLYCGVQYFLGKALHRTHDDT
ncbi:hypothetical protein AVEN_253191-1 [Araneus ventricosus]|uniref:Uncharacterized protein n=1 Tax=Araneus ventricosus TaxID=182803 RepID=A0A4Y2SK71_ARAVE|nr:hypothetical protein AVEN_243428-1 [Araneus ventricosus]GBN88324.1 hypothetical protein AVEN_253191-1 [Araneus ventricosus]